MIRQLKEIEELLEDFPALLGEAGQPGYLVLYDDRGTSIRAYQVPSTSYIVIVDREGKVAYTGLGGTQEFDAVLRRVTQG